MLKHFRGVGVALLMLLGGLTQAPAGGCPGFGASCGCGPVVAVAPPCQPLVESYLINQGPVLSGPGHYLNQLVDPAPCCYPYVGFVYSGYPYGAYGAGGYPRGFYNPYVGYPYADEPPPYYRYGRFAHRAAYRHVAPSYGVHRRIRYWRGPYWRGR
jgi:hypothetical protein